MNQTEAAVGNATSAALASSSSTLTTVHLALLALLAVLVVIGIIYGARLKHRRDAAERDIEVHAQEAGVTPEPDTVPVEEAAAPPVERLAPAPPPPPRLTDVPPARREPEALADQPNAATPLDTAPATAAPVTPADAAAPGNGPITQLKGLGPKVAARFGELGITTVGQIAALDDDDAERIDAQLGAFSGRMQRDRWIEQARFLAAGDKPGFEAVFGRL